MEQLIQYCKAHWMVLSLLPGNLLAFDALARSAAEAHGYKKTAAILSKIGNFLSFIIDILGGWISKKPTENTGNPGKTGG